MLRTCTGLRSPILWQLNRSYSTKSSSTSVPTTEPIANSETKTSDNKATAKKKVSTTDADEALRLAMAGIDGGGMSAVELEGGKPVGLKRGVQANMFRVI